MSSDDIDYELGDIGRLTARGCKFDVVERCLSACCQQFLDF